MSPAYDVFISLRFCEAERAGHALKQSLEKQGLTVFLCHESPGDDVATAIIQALHGCTMAVILGTETYGKRTNVNFSTFHELRYIVDEEKPFFLIKMCHEFAEPEARFRFTKSTLFYPWLPRQDIGASIDVPADLVDEISAKVQRLPDPPQHNKEEAALTQDRHGGVVEADIVYDLGRAEEGEDDAGCRTYEQPKPSLLPTSETAFGAVYSNSMPTDAGATQGVGTSNNAPRPSEAAWYETPDDDATYQELYAMPNDMITGFEVYGGGAKDARQAPILETTGSLVSIRDSHGDNSQLHEPTASSSFRTMPQDLATFSVEATDASMAVKPRRRCSARVLLLMVLAALVVLGIAVAVPVAVGVSSGGSAGGSGNDDDDAFGAGNTSKSTTAIITMPPTTTRITTTLSCSGSTTATLDCGDLTSQGLFAGADVCEAAAVVNCCCDEFYGLKRVAASVSVHPSQTSLRFGDVTSVGGDVLAAGGVLQAVNFEGLAGVGGSLDLSYNSMTGIDFATLTEVGGNIDLSQNGITSIAFGFLTTVEGTVDVSGNSISSLDFGCLTSIGGALNLSHTGITSINFGNLASVGGDIDLSGNNITSIEFGQLTHVEGNLVLFGASLTVANGIVQGGVHLAHSSLVEIHFGALSRVISDLDLRGSDLTSVHFGNLSSVGGELNLNNNNLASVYFGALTSVGGALKINSNALTSVHFGNLSSVGGLDLSHNVITSVEFGLLTSVHGDLNLGYNDLASIDFGPLVYLHETLDLSSNDLTSVDFGGLSSVGNNLLLGDNALATIAFGNVSAVVGHLQLHSNILTSIDFGSLTAVGGELFLPDNYLSIVECNDLYAGCICTDSGVTLVGCPSCCPGGLCGC